jgi:hypothetical protein
MVACRTHSRYIYVVSAIHESIKLKVRASPFIYLRSFLLELALTGCKRMILSYTCKK